MHKAMVQTIGHVQAQPVDVKRIHPVFDTFQKIVCDGRILKVQFYQFKMSFPAFIPEPIIIIAVAVEIDMEPVFIRGIPLLFLYVLKCPESAAYMVEYAVQDDFYSMCVQVFAYTGKIIICAKSAVDFLKIPGIIPVAVGFKDRIQQDRVHAQFLKIS